MQFYDDSTTVASPPALPAAGTPGYFTDGVVGVQARTLIRGWWLNLVATELMSPVVAAGLTPSRVDGTQLKQAILLLAQGEINTAIAPLATTAALAAETTARNAAITAAINTLVGGAPGALDTLNELATALNDDAAFSATITNLLAQKAPLANPGLTGGTTQTQAANDDSTKLATTAYADRAANNVASVGNLSAANGPWWTWDAGTGLVHVFGQYTAAITSEGPVTVNFPVNIGSFRWANADIIQPSNVDNTTSPIASWTTTSLTIQIQDNVGSSGASAQGFFFEAKGYSATNPSL